MILAKRITGINRSSRRIVLAGLVVIVAVAMYRWIVTPFTTQLMAAQQYDSTLDAAVNKLTGLGSTIEAKRAKLEKLTRQAELKKDELFNPEQVRGFFATLQPMAEKAGCTVQSISLVPEKSGQSDKGPKSDSSIAGKKVVVAFMGGFGNVNMFLSKLQTYESKVWIESVSMNVADYTGRLRCQVVLAIYCTNLAE